MNSAEEKQGSEIYTTETGVEYRPHSMMHRAVVQMAPTKLEMIDRFERTDAGHKFTPENSNVRVMINGRDWSEKKFLIYGSKSTDEAQNYVSEIIERVRDIGHSAQIISEPEITNIAVSGDLNTTIQLESLASDLASQGVDVEYEPEQFPALIVRVDELSVTVLLFSTGSFSIQGLDDLQDIEPAIEAIEGLLHR